MKHLLLKLLIVVFLVIGFSSFVLLKNTKPEANKTDVGNIRFNGEMENGFSDRE